MSRHVIRFEQLQGSPKVRDRVEVKFLCGCFNCGRRLCGFSLKDPEQPMARSLCWLAPVGKKDYEPYCDTCIRRWSQQRNASSGT